MKIATWNVNSVRARKERVLAWLEQHQPDVLCMQETKVTDDLFPVADFEAVGYRVAIRGQKTYNGVAVAVRGELAEVDYGYGEEARIIAATVEGVRVICVYVPNGREVGHDHYHYKLGWLAELRDYLDRTCAPDAPVVLCGDFNVAPDDRDLYDPEGWKGANLASDPEREALLSLTSWGLTDAFRSLHQEAGLYTWWDYRMLGFPKNRGLRIDHLYVTKPVLDRLTSSSIDREARKGKGASDHAPVVIELAP